ncbi:MAG: hypothetical protein R2863_01755 [Candidatus Kapaibacterium sp.]|nr:hypothetical protein [Ignavibacteriota bacterium]MCB9220692.1 hypothetical protein [Ignavibacteria bacterium]
MKRLEKEEMIDLISDYSFGKLSSYEAEIFEFNLDRFPELKDEIVSIKSAFSKVDKERILDVLNNKTANMPYLVNLRKYEQVKSANLRKNLVKISIPIIAVIGFFLIMREFNFSDNEAVSGYSEDLLTSDEANIIFANIDVDNYNPYLNEFYFEDEVEVSNNNYFISIASNYLIYNYLNEITESEFNELLDEIDNEEFNL